MNNYQKQALEFLENTGTTIDIEFLKNDFHFINDKEKRDIYKVSIKRGKRIYTFNFGNSIVNSGFYYTINGKKYDLPLNFLDSLKEYENKEARLINYIKQKINYSFNIKAFRDTVHIPTAPTEYDILACLTKNNPGTLEDFCNEYGYDEDTKTAESIYNAVKEEYFYIATLYNEKEMQELQEIS